MAASEGLRVVLVDFQRFLERSPPSLGLPIGAFEEHQAHPNLQIRVLGLRSTAA